MKQVVFKNEHERLTAWMRELLRIAKVLGQKETGLEGGVKGYRLPDGLKLYETGGRIIVTGQRQKGQIYDNLMTIDLGSKEISFETETNGEILYSNNSLGDVQTFVYLPDGTLDFSEEGKDSGATIRIDKELERILGRNLSDDYRRSYTNSLEFYKVIENLMPGELKGSLEGKDLASDEKQMLISQIKNLQIESNMLDQRLLQVASPVRDEH